MFRWGCRYIYLGYGSSDGFWCVHHGGRGRSCSQLLLAVDVSRLGQLSSVVASLANMVARDLDLMLGVDVF